MPNRKLITGIDLGSSSVRVVISETSDASHPPKILGTGMAESRGVRQGYVVNVESTAKSILLAVSRAEKAAGTKINSAFLGAGGVGLEGIIATGSSLVSSADGEVRREDVERACLSAEGFLRDHANKKVLQSVPLSFRLDGKEVLGRPRGMKGIKLEVRVLAITALSQHINDLIGAADLAGIDVLDVLPSPAAASAVALTKLERTAGCVLADIGAETVSVTVFENNLPISLQVFPTGSMSITNDIALKMKISLKDAERDKINRFDSRGKREFEDIIQSRLNEIFEFIEAHLKKIDRSALLPAGIIMIGAGSGIKKIEETAKESLSLPAKIAEVRYRTRPHETTSESTSKEKLLKDGPAWAVAYGLCVLGNQNDEDESLLRSGGEFFASMRKKVSGLFRQFLP